MEGQECLWFVSIIFLPNLKETVPFQFIYELQDKQEVISLWKFHVKHGAKSISELRFTQWEHVLT